MDQISVIIPYYNSAEFISQTLLSLKKQTYENWECLLVDDGSSDDSSSICKSFAENDERFTLLKREKRKKGPSSCRNIGLEASSGKYVLFLDSDDLLADTSLEYRIEQFVAHQELDFIVFQMAMLDSPNIGLVQISPDYLRTFLSFKFPWSISCPLWKRSFLESLGGFNESLMLLEDPELHIRALIKSTSFKVFYDQKPDFFYRKSQKSLQKRDLIYKRKIQNYLEFINSVAELSELSSSYKKEMRNGFIIFISELITPISNSEITKIKNTFKKTKKNKVINYYQYFISNKLINKISIFKNRYFQKIILIKICIIIDSKNYLKNIYKYKLSLK